MSLNYPARQLVISLVVLIVFGCEHKQTSVSCPAGSQLMGTAPPKGSELWCQKIVDGKPVKNGPFIVFAAGGGEMIEGNYRNGVQDGEWTLWYENGARASVDYYVNGRQNGHHISWYANGQKAIEGEYREGKREGGWTQWDPAGLKTNRIVYKDGKVAK